MKSWESTETNASRKEIIGNYEIVRSEETTSNDWTGKKVGHKKVFYDVCVYSVDNDGEFIDSFKTLAEARRFAKSL